MKVLHSETFSWFRGGVAGLDLFHSGTQKLLRLGSGTFAPEELRIHHICLHPFSKLAVFPFRLPGLLEPIRSVLQSVTGIVF